MRKFLTFLFFAFSLYFIVPLFAEEEIPTEEVVPEGIVADTSPPRAQSITYFDLDHNGKVDQIVVGFDEPIFWTPSVPYSTGMTIYTRRWGLVASGVTTNLDFSDHIISASLAGSNLTLGLLEGDMIKNNLLINTNAGSSNYSDLKVGLFAQANIADILGNTMNSIAKIMSTSKFPNSSTGVFNATTGIDFLDTGYLYGSNFSGALSVQKIDSRSKIGSLVLSGIILSVSADSFLGDGNTLQVGVGARLDGNNTTLTVGSESHILSSTGMTLFGKEGFSSSFRTLSGEVLSSVSTVTESGIYYTYNGTLIGSGLTLTVDYVSWSGDISLFSGELSWTSTLVELPHALSLGNLRAAVSRSFGAGESASFSGITLLFDTLTQTSVTFAASIVSTGSVSDVTKTSAQLSWVIFRPSVSGNISYGTGILSHTGTVNSGLFSFSWLLAGNTYFYRLGLVPFPSWDEIYSETGSFITLPAAIPPPPITIVFQNTTYLTDQNPLLNEFTCDNTHADCKINFNLESSFGSGYTASDYFCELDFDLDYESGEEYKCNPNNVTFPRGHDYHLHFRIIHTPEVSLYTERSILIHSPTLTGSTSSSGSTSTGTTSESGTTSSGSNIPPEIAPPPVVNSGGGSSWSPLPILPSIISILPPTIIVQSGLDTNNRCTKIDCTLNLEYKVLGPKESCSWDFSGGSYLSGTQNKCNPGYVHYPLGEFSVTLRVFEQGNTSNYRESVLYFSNGTPAQIVQAKNAPENHAPVALIKLQWTLGKTKIQQGNSVTCTGATECSINLSWEESYDLDHDKLTYDWNFGNGQTSDKENPLSIKYTTWEYEIILRVTDTKGSSSEASFHVSVSLNDQKEIVSTKPLDSNVFSLKITGASPNPLGNDGVSEWVEITNPLGVDISLATCTLDDEIEKGSDPYTFVDSAIIRTNSSKRFYKLQTLLNLNNTGDSVNLVCGGRLVSALAWDYSVPEGFIVSWKEWPYSGRVRTKVLRVVDGDTIIIELYGKEEKVRLIGVDTPETVDPRKEVQYYWKEASNYTRRELEGREVELEFDFNPRDKYDRLLAYVWIDGKNFDSELIRLGYARAYLRFPFRYFKEFEKIGKEAEKNKVGLWADPEVRQLLLADAKEDKKALEEQLKEEDKAILDDLVEVAKDTKIGSEKMDAEILDRLLALDASETNDAIKYKKVREVLQEQSIEEIHISLQWQLSKNRSKKGNIFTCHAKTTCSVNFTAGKIRKGTIYYWDFGNGETFYGANPVAHKFAPGKYTVSLKIYDERTGNIREELFHIDVEKLVSVKKPKVLQIASEKTEKPVVIKGQDYFDPPALEKPMLSPLQAATSTTAVVLVFFGGVYGVLRRRWVIM
jgi:micrococcal nuclease